MTIADALFVLIDTETAGVDPGDDLLEVAARHVDAYGRTWARFHSLVRPTRPIPSTASAIHHLLDGDFDAAPERADVEEALLRFVPHGAVVVAHNAAFDARVLADGPRFGDRDCRWLCTMRLARHLAPDAPGFGNAALFYHLGLGRIDGALHRADADLDVTAALLVELLARYKAAGEPDDVDALLAFSQRPYVMETMPLGKHRGKPFAEVARVDRRYLEWMLTGMDGLDADLRFNVERALGRIAA